MVRQLVWQRATASRRLAPKCLPPQGLFNRRGLATEASSVSSRMPPYPKILRNLEEVRRVLGSSRALTLAEKILYAHLANPEESLLSGTDNGRDIRGKANLKLKPDRVAMQDASAQMALLQFMSCGLPSTAVPASIHCDHMIVGERGADTDLPASIKGNSEVFDFLESAAKRYGIEFWAPGAGIIHQSVLENYAAPGLMMLGTDSHTPNAGGLGAIAIGVGGADAVDALVDAPWELKAPRVLGVRLEGKLNGWAAPKDIILHLAGKLTVRGGTGFIIEYHGPGVETLSCTGQATICNMGAEVGATTSVFPFSPSMIPYLQATHRGDVAKAAAEIAASGPKNLLRADNGAEYDQVITIDLSTLEPHINGPFTPDLSVPLSAFADTVREKNWPETFGAGLIGSCTNSSYEDMTRAEDLVKQASAAGLKPKADFFITPGSEQIRATLDRDQTLSTFASAGGTVLANACGPCIGQWKRTDGVAKGEDNAIFTSYNRNFPGRNDGNRRTMNFLASPELVTALAYSGRTTFNPMTDSLTTPSGEEFRFQPPTGSALPADGFEDGNPDFKPTAAAPDASCEVVVSPTSDRLALLEPFAPFPKGNLSGLKVLYKVKGQCTTDTISAAGPWLKYKGHLPNISANTLIGAVNAATGETNVAYDEAGKQYSIPDLAAQWKAEGIEWLVVAEDNYGEGSAREHAALQPRYLGGRIILSKSFARIHETNLKKQGVVPLTFENPADYDRIDACDKVDTVGLYETLQAGGQGSIKLQKMETLRTAFADRPRPLLSYGVPFETAAAKHINDLFHASRVYIICSSSLSRNTDVLDRLNTSIGKNKIVGTRIGMRSHTYWSEILEIVHEARDSGADLILTIGAGSLTDGAKVVALALSNNVQTKADLSKLPVTPSQQATIHAPTIPIISIPTTLSAGEYSNFAGATDDTTQRKHTFQSPLKGPELVILDPSLTTTTPDSIWLSTGIRAVDHCIETFVAVEHTSEKTDRLALHALGLLVPGLLGCKVDKGDVEARLQCQLGSVDAMAACTAGVQLGASHGIGHQLGPLGRRGLDATKVDLGDVLDVVIRELGMPRSLKDVGVGRDQLDQLAENSLHDRWCKTNPVPLTEKSQILEILEMVVE
ncbi:aconitate hydratase mitochondrial precursor [Aspergillus flavus]|uniref:Aconitate hydratase mitochondrial n=1 Tax=Aspergillus flavus (strain ATCC 200026 / FGSC A1120 / IAM 13836 / NRRL 3357 / JCM 12722 / SRRC 167) TaxID=332952 RepID=A0A7U2QRI7_ASPFN|nr:aconitate hydratase mitochondrial precursor [Aspergillus flavus]